MSDTKVRERLGPPSLLDCTPGLKNHGRFQIGEDSSVEDIKLFAEARGQSDDAEALPVDLWAELATPSLPDGCLPKVIEELAKHQAKLMGVDPGGMATAALTVCAAHSLTAFMFRSKSTTTTGRRRHGCGLALSVYQAPKRRRWLVWLRLRSQKSMVNFIANMRKQRKNTTHFSQRKRRTAKSPNQQRVMLMDVTTRTRSGGDAGFARWHSCVP